MRARNREAKSKFTGFLEVKAQTHDRKTNSDFTCLLEVYQG